MSNRRRATRGKKRPNPASPALPRSRPSGTPLKKILPALAVAAAVLAVYFLVHRGRHEFPVSRVENPNILLITVDTLRADRVGAYGYQRAKTPNLDALAAGGVLFENAITSVPLTLPSHTSVFTGTYPLHHGVRNNGNYRLAPEATTMSEVFKQRGYTTAGFVASFVLDPRFGLAQGFDHYDADVQEVSDGAWYAERRAADVTESFLRWFRSRGQRPFFAWVHYWDPHMPYDPPEPYRSACADPYDGEVAYVDAQIGVLLEALRSQGVLDRTLVIVASDHGEGFGDHVELGHGIFCYDETLHVVLIMASEEALPRHRRISDRVNLVDLLPTVLDLTGIPIPREIQGTSLVPLVKGERMSEREFYIESYYAAEDLGAAPVIGVVSGSYKFLDLPRPELYDLKKDPEEHHNLASQDVRSLAKWRLKVEKLVKLYGESTLPAKRQVSKSERERLASLGYLSRGKQAASPGSRADPKDIVASDVEIVKGKTLVVQKRTDEAEACFKRAIAIQPANLTAYLLLSELYNRLDRRRDAIDILVVGIRANPDDSRLRYRLALVLIKNGRPQEALSELLSIEAKGNFWDRASLLESIGLAYEKLGRRTEAARIYRTIIESGIDREQDKRYRIQIALLQMDDGKRAEAQAELDSINEEEVKDVRLVHTVALAYARLRLYEKAEVWFQRSLSLQRSPNILFNYALMKKESGDRESARSLLKELLTVISDSHPLWSQASSLLRELH
jgi:arylsulfatase A-like enzyme/Tfp pilus assembly protein PilF